jgi:hypothetical protein
MIYITTVRGYINYGKYNKSICNSSLDLYKYILRITALMETSNELMTKKDKLKYIDIYLGFRNFNRGSSEIILDDDDINIITYLLENSNRNIFIKILKYQ